MTGKIVLYCTASSHDEAAAIARSLIVLKLAACVQIVPQVQSIYHWKGAVEQASEFLLIVKSRADLYSEIETEIRRLHSYAVPEIVALPIVQGSDAYLDWIDAETARE